MDINKQMQEEIRRHRELLAVFENDCLPPLRQAADLLIASIESGGTIYTCGNGGSAADAQHVAAELVGRFRRQRRALPAVALTTDTSLLTSVSNDYGFEQIFVRQVDAHIHKGDVLWAFSTSGTSKNILAAAQRAREKGARVLAFTGKKVCPLNELADISICIDGPTSTVQEIHQLGYHILCDCVEARFADKP